MQRTGVTTIAVTCPLSSYLYLVICIIGIILTETRCDCNMNLFYIIDLSPPRIVCKLVRCKKLQWKEMDAAVDVLGWYYLFPCEWYPQWYCGR